MQTRDGEGALAPCHSGTTKRNNDMEDRDGGNFRDESDVESSSRRDPSARAQLPYAPICNQSNHADEISNSAPGDPCCKPGCACRITESGRPSGTRKKGEWSGSWTRQDSNLRPPDY